MGISDVGSFPVLSGGSLIIFQFLRCRNLALNRVFFLLFLEAGMFYIWGCLDAPTLGNPPYVHTPHTFICPLGVYTLTCPPYSCVSVCSHRLLFVVGGCKGPLTCWTPPLYLYDGVCSDVCFLLLGA